MADIYPLLVVPALTVSTAWVEQKPLVRGDSPARGDTRVLSASGFQRYVVQRGGADSAPCMHIHKGISTQRSDSGEESQEDLHSEETIGGRK
jgi:hypothetical protein